MSASESAFLGKKVALGISGGIATYKAAEILRGLQRAGCSVRVAMTKRACEFVQPLTFRALSGSHVLVDDYAPDNPDPIAHITFSQSADLLLIAPATANLIAKFANGIADDFLTTTYLASKAPVLIAPAMNTTMWHHPATQRNLARLREYGVLIVEPDEGEMACGTVGPGRLSEPERIVTAALELLQSTPGNNSTDLGNEHFLITTGGTREQIDPIRFISNRSSGRMGFALAQAALKRGASVTVVAAATSASPPAGIRLLRAISAEEMYRTVLDEVANATVFIAAAAVADYRPTAFAPTKVKKDKPTIALSLERTRDILQEVSALRKDGLLVIGFAAETDNVIENAREKLKSKNLDAIIANDVSRTESGFDSPQNEITIITRAGADAPLCLPLMDKVAAAHIVLDEVAKLRNALITSPA
jgi:phosphopantothenoylcysteine decarboxylase/phosphopantothenate--cysteine ligase